jgi:hypothetical protein
MRRWLDWLMDRHDTTLRLTDLAAPRLSPVQQAAIANAEATAVDWTASAVLDAARQATGLYDFGATDFIERLEIWLQAGAEDIGLNAFGRGTLFSYGVRYAANRLRLEHLVSEHPEILAEHLEKPLFIAGLPRSGTTHLVNQVACDARWRSLPYWEAADPFPTDPSVETRRRKAAGEWESLDTLLPRLKVMHEMSPDHVHEDLELMALDFTTYNIEWTAHVPRWRDWYLAHDRRPHYGYLKRALQALQFLDKRNGKPRRRWLLKCPQHLENLGPLIETFPDAVVVLTHRDPVDVVQSAATMIAYGDRLRRHRIELGATVDYWTDRIERLLRACVMDRHLLPEARSLDVMFPSLVTDEEATVERVYALAGEPLTPEALAAIRTHRARGTARRVSYDLAADFGRDPSALRERFGFYLQRFPGLLVSA